MTVYLIDGKPHAQYSGVGFVPVRGMSPRDVEALDFVEAAARITGITVTTVPGLNVLPDIPDEMGPIGFRPRR
jgi:hypothetical protein